MIICCSFFQALLQDVMSHRRMVDSVIDKAKAVVQSSESKEISLYVTDTTAQYESHINDAKVNVFDLLRRTVFSAT